MTGTRVTIVRSLCLLLVIAPAVVQGGIVRVPGDQPTIELGLILSAEGDTVLVAPGTYMGDGNWGFWAWPNRTLLSEAGPHATIIDGDWEYCRCMDILSIDGFVLEGFTFQHGAGALRINDSAPVIRRCIFRDLTFASGFHGVRGGAVLVGSGSEPAFEDCLFVNNQVHGYGEADYATGGAIHCGSASVHLDRCTFIGNEATMSYGGGGFGGAIHSYQSQLHLTNSSLFGNAASQAGGGVALDYSSAQIENTIIAFSDDGGAIECLPFVDITVSCSDIYGNQGGDWIDCIADQFGINGNISQDPLFCDVGSDTLTIRSDSPCAPENSPPGCGLIGAWPVGCYITGVGSEGVPECRPRLSIHPNPVFFSTEFSIEGDTRGATIEILDAQGRFVDLIPMNRNTAWKPKDSTPAGVYFARLRSHADSDAVKLVLIR